MASQARGDCADVGNLAGAEPVDVGGAGPALLRGALRGNRAARQHREQKTEHRRPSGPAQRRHTSRKPGLLVRVSLIGLALARQASSTRIRELIFAECDFSHTKSRLRGSSVSGGDDTLQ